MLSEMSSENMPWNAMFEKNEKLHLNFVESESKSD